MAFNKILCGDLILLIESSNQRMREQMFGDRSEYDQCCEEKQSKNELHSTYHDITVEIRVSFWQLYQI